MPVDGLTQPNCPPYWQHSPQAEPAHSPSCMCRLSCLLWVHWAAVETGALFVVCSPLKPWTSTTAARHQQTADIRLTAYPAAISTYSQHTAQACTTVAPAAPLPSHPRAALIKITPLPLAGQHQLCRGSCSILTTACWAVGGRLHCTQCFSPCFETPSQTTNQCRQWLSQPLQCVQLSSASWRW